VVSGFQVQALYGFGERDNLASEGVVTEAQLSYTQGPLAVSYSMGKIAAAPTDATTFAALAASSSQAALSAVSAGSEYKEQRLMASYDLGVARLAAGTYSQKTAGASADKASHITVTMPLDALTLGATYMTVKDAQATTTTAKLDGYSVSAKYALSKRTYGYAFYRSMDKTAAQTATPTGLYIGMNHSF
jgi:predicted porin